MMYTSSFYKFSFWGFLGYIVIIFVLIFSFNHRKKFIIGFEISIFVFVCYFIYILPAKTEYNVSLTVLNNLWFIPFLLCSLVDIVLYLINKFN